MAGLRIENLRKSYEGVEAVAGVSITAKEGEFLTLLGPSGCGKTTTLRLVAGLLEPDEGEIYLDDELISSPEHSRPPEKRQMGMVFQSYAVWPHMSVHENVAYGLKRKKVHQSEIERRVNDALALVHLQGMGDRLPTQLSGGQQQRVALARSLAIEPKTLLLDEPLSNLDAKLRESMRFELKDIQEQTGLTMLYVTHDQDEAMVLSDRIVVMKSGVIEQVGPPSEIYDSPKTEFVADFIGTTNLVPATVVDARESTVQLPSGREISVSALERERQRGDNVVISMRPEHLSFTPGSSKGFNEFEANVSHSVYRGSSRHYRCVSPDLGEVTVEAPTRSRVRRGESATLYIAVDRCIAVTSGPKRAPGDEYDQEATPPAPNLGSPVVP